MPNLDPFHQLRNAADVVAMMMRDQDIVNSFETGSMGGGDDAVRIPSIKSGPASIDQQGLSRGTHDQSRLSAFNIDGIDSQWFGGAASRQCRSQSQE